MNNDELEPTAYLFDHTGDDDAQIVRMADKGGGSKYWTAKEPLVRISDLPHLVEFIFSD